MWRASVQSPHVDDLGARAGIEKVGRALVAHDKVVEGARFDLIGTRLDHGRLAGRQTGLIFLPTLLGAGCVLEQILRLSFAAKAIAGLRDCDR